MKPMIISWKFKKVRTTIHIFYRTARQAIMDAVDNNAISIGIYSDTGASSILISWSAFLTYPHGSIQKITAIIARMTG